MIGEMTFPAKVRRHRGLDDISYMALVGMKNDYQFPKYFSNKDDLIINVVCEWYGTTAEALKNRRRIRGIVEPRQICMFLLRRYSNLSLKEIGMKFGGFDHTTVIHSSDTVQDLMDTDEKIRQTIQALEVKIQ